LLCLVTSADHFRGAVFAIVPSAICTFRKKSCLPQNLRDRGKRPRIIKRAPASRRSPAEPARTHVCKRSIEPFADWPVSPSGQPLRSAQEGRARAPAGWLPVRRAMGPGNGRGPGLQIREALAAFYLMSQ
jgi:hypothetical protein